MVHTLLSQYLIPSLLSTCAVARSSTAFPTNRVSPAVSAICPSSTACVCAAAAAAASSPSGYPKHASWPADKQGGIVVGCVVGDVTTSFPRESLLRRSKISQGVGIIWMRVCGDKRVTDQSPLVSI